MSVELGEILAALEFVNPIALHQQIAQRTLCNV